VLIVEVKDQGEADELRSYAAEAIERLTNDIDVLVIVAQHCRSDPFWKSRMHGLFLVERLLKRQPDLLDGFVTLIEPLSEDEYLCQHELEFFKRDRAPFPHALPLCTLWALDVRYFGDHAHSLAPA
jgi:hypothetical protein